MDLGNGPIDKREIKKCFHKRHGILKISLFSQKLNGRGKSLELISLKFCYK